MSRVKGVLIGGYFLPIILKMQPISVFEVLGEVLTSWQVIAATIAIILFLNIVFSVARSYRRPKSIREKFAKIAKARKAKSVEKEEIIIESDNDDDDDADDDE